MTMDQGFTAIPASASDPTMSLDSFLTGMATTLRRELSVEIKQEIVTEIVERIIRTIHTAMPKEVVAQIAVPVPEVNVAATPALVEVTNNMNMEEMCASLSRIELLLTQLVAVMRSPVIREVHRGSDNLIDSLTERRS